MNGRGAPPGTTPAPELLGGRYELRGILGRGGMALVYDGWDTRLHRSVAVKLLLPSLVRNVEDRLHFELEARAAGAFSHPHIVAVHDVGEDDGIPFIVLERLAGPSLDVRIAQGPVSQTMVRMVLDDVLAALTVAHAAGVLHRDIKPGNVVFASTGTAKLADFGIAKSAQGGITATGHVLGTMAYLSPERLLGKPAGPVDDLYALGVLGYEALTGRRPYMHDNPGALAHAILHEDPPPLVALRPDVDPALAAVIERATARDPAERFYSAGAMQAALRGQLPSVSARRPATRVMAVPLPPPAVATRTAPPRLTRSRRTWLSIGAIAAAFILAIGLFALGSAQPMSPRPATDPTPSVPTTSPSMTSPSPAPPTSAVPAPADRPGKGPGKRGHGNGNGNGNGD